MPFGRFAFYLFSILLPVFSVAQNRYDMLITEFLAVPTLSNGLPESELVNNTLWAASGTFRWDGLDDQQNLLLIGNYIIYVELFLMDGTHRKQTTVYVLARKRRRSMEVWG